MKDDESNGSGFYVFTTVKAGFEPTYNETKIKKGEVELSLTHDEVMEMISTLKGERGNISSSEMDGYVPKETYLYSQNKFPEQIDQSPAKPLQKHNGTLLTDHREIDMDKRDLTPIAKLPEYAGLCRDLETALRGMMEMHGDLWDHGYVDDRAARAAAILSLHNAKAES